MKNTSRRDFLRLAGSGMALGAASSITRPAFALPRMAELGFGHKRLVVVVLRGGLDFQSVVAPIGDTGYATHRPELSIDTGDSTWSLGDSFFAGSESSTNLKPMWDAGELAIVERVGYEDALRTHFEAQHVMDTADVNQRSEGFVAKYGEVRESPNEVMGFFFKSLRPLDSDTLSFPQVTAELDTYFLEDDDLIGDSTSGLTAAYGGTTSVHRDGRHVLESMGEIRNVVQGMSSYPPAGGLGYSVATPFGRNFRDADICLRETGCRVAVIGDRGYDTHSDQGRPIVAENSTNHIVIHRLCTQLLNFRNRMMDPTVNLWNDTVVVVMSEFGRTVKENENLGTDHGLAGGCLVLGGNVNGGVHHFADTSDTSGAGWWQKSSPSSPLSPLDPVANGVQHAVDFRTILEEIFRKHMGVGVSRMDDIVYDWSGISSVPDPDRPALWNSLNLLP